VANQSAYVAYASRATATNLPNMWQNEMWPKRDSGHAPQYVETAARVVISVDS
jgi:hypothetical protein